MGSLQDDFERAAAEVHDLCTRPTEVELLSLYGLYKQAMVGNNDTDKPWAINMKEKAKWTAWKEMWGCLPQGAAREYIRLVSELKYRYGYQGDSGFCPT